MYEEKKRGFRGTLRSTIYALIIVAAVSILIAALFMPVIMVTGSSMEPTLKDGEILVLRSRGSVGAGDIVGFYSRGKLLQGRIIACPGDTVEIDGDGSVYVNGELQGEPYITGGTDGTGSGCPVSVPAGQYFVMGDNRQESVDSRSPEVGCIEGDQILGKVILRVWPFRQVTMFW